MTRKPNLKDKIEGCCAFFKEMVIGIFTFDVARVQLGWMLFKETAKGNFEVSDN